MAKLPNPQDLARELIAVLADRDCRPGDGMPIQSARMQFGIARPAEDFAAAVKHAEAMGWIVLGRDGLWITLTAEGFEEA